MKATYVRDNLRAANVNEVRAMHSPELGVTVKIKPLIIGGIVQPNHKCATVEITDTAIGRTCAGLDFMENERKVKNDLRRLCFCRK